MKKLLLTLAALIMSVPALFAGSVTFYFQWGETEMEIDNPSYWYNIWNDTKMEPVNLPSDWFMFYDIEETTILKISPDDYDYGLDIIVSDFDETNNYDLYQEGSEWYLTLYQDTDNISFYLNLYEPGQTPGGGASEVSVNFNIEGIANASNYVTISYFDRALWSDVTYSGSPVQVAAGTSFEIIPVTGYIVSDIVSYNNDGIASISKPQVVTGTWNVAIENNPSGDNVSFDVTIATAPKTAWINFSSQTLSSPHIAVEVSPSIYDMGTSNEVILPENYTIYPNTTDPDVQYEILGYTVKNATGGETALPSGCTITNNNGVYTVNLTEAAAGYTITFEVAEVALTDGVNVSFEFVGVDLEDEPYTYVTLGNMDYLAPIAVTANEFTYTYNTPVCTLVLGLLEPEIYEMSITNKGLQNNEDYVEITKANEGSYYLYFGAYPEQINKLPAFVVTIGLPGTTGVNSINSDNGFYRVYNMQGVKVLEGESLNGLAKGLYIVNGKKVVIR